MPRLDTSSQTRHTLLAGCGLFFSRLPSSLHRVSRKRVARSPEVRLWQAADFWRAAFVRAEEQSMSSASRRKDHAPTMKYGISEVPSTFAMISRFPVHKSVALLACSKPWQTIGDAQKTLPFNKVHQGSKTVGHTS